MAPLRAPSNTVSVGSDRSYGGVGRRSGHPAPAQRVGDARGGAPRLDTRTYLHDTGGDGPRIEVTIREFPGRLAEMTAIKLPEGGRLGFSRKRGGEGTPRQRREMREEDLERSIRRSRIEVRRRVLAANMDRMLTLTFRANVTDYRLADSCLTKFLRALQDRIGPVPYVSVPERQQRGAWHFHLALNRKVNVNLVRKVWRDVVGVLEGNIDISRGKAQNHKQRCRAIAVYLCKYLCKKFDDWQEMGRHRYRSSHGLLARMRVTRFSIPLCPGAEYVLLARELYARTGQRVERCHTAQSLFGTLYWFATY